MVLLTLDLCVLGTLLRFKPYIQRSIQFMSYSQEMALLSQWPFVLRKNSCGCALSETSNMFVLVIFSMSAFNSLSVSGIWKQLCCARVRVQRKTLLDVIWGNPCSHVLLPSILYCFCLPTHLNEHYSQRHCNSQAACACKKLQGWSELSLGDSTPLRGWSHHPSICCCS